MHFIPIPTVFNGVLTIENICFNYSKLSEYQI